MANKVEKYQADEKKRTQLLPGFKDDFAKGTAHALSLTNDCMRDFIRYFFQKQVKGLGQLGKAKLVDILQPLLHGEGGAESDSGNFSMCWDKHDVDGYGESTTDGSAKEVDI